MQVPAYSQPRGMVSPAAATYSYQYTSTPGVATQIIPPQPRMTVGPQPAVYTPPMSSTYQLPQSLARPSPGGYAPYNPMPTPSVSSYGPSYPGSYGPRSVSPATPGYAPSYPPTAPSTLPHPAPTPSYGTAGFAPTPSYPTSMNPPSMNPPSTNPSLNSPSSIPPSVNPSTPSNAPSQYSDLLRQLAPPSLFNEKTLAVPLSKSSTPPPKASAKKPKEPEKEFYDLQWENDRSHPRGIRCSHRAIGGERSHRASV